MTLPNPRALLGRLLCLVAGHDWHWFQDMEQEVGMQAICMRCETQLCRSCPYCGHVYPVDADRIYVHDCQQTPEPPTPKGEDR